MKEALDQYGSRLIQIASSLDSEPWIAMIMFDDKNRDSEVVINFEENMMGKTPQVASSQIVSNWQEGSRTRFDPPYASPKFLVKLAC